MKIYIYFIFKYFIYVGIFAIYLYIGQWRQTGHEGKTPGEERGYNMGRTRTRVPLTTEPDKNFFLFLIVFLFSLNKISHPRAVIKILRCIENHF